MNGGEQFSRIVRPVEVVAKSSAFAGAADTSKFRCRSASLKR